MREIESTITDDVPVEEKRPPITEINDYTMKSLLEASMVLSVIINDISSEKPDNSTAGRDSPNCLMEQANMISLLAKDVMKMAREIKNMISE